jgi:flagellar export protein FliJ
VIVKQQLDESRNQQEERLQQYLEKSNKTESATLRQIQCHTSHLELVNKKMADLSKELDKANTNVRTQRSKLAEAHKQLHIMEKVRDFEHTLFNEEEFRSEQKFMDEIATQSFGK